MSTVTVHDAIQLALPQPATVLAGEAGLYRTISWPVVARAVAPIFTELNGNEIALISVSMLRDVDPPIALAALVERLAMVPVSAIMISGSPDTSAVAAAERLAMPLIAVAADADIRETERELQRLLSDVSVHIERRAAQIALELGELSLAGHGLASMLSLLSSKLNRSIALFSSREELIGFHGDPSHHSLAQSMMLRTGDFRVGSVDVWCLPLMAANQTIGTVVLLGNSLTNADRATTKRAGMALALELSKTQALSAVEERYRGNFLEQLLAGALADSRIMQQRARDANVDLRKHYVAVICLFSSVAHANASTSIAAQLPSFASALLTAPHTAGVLCMVPVEGKSVSNKELIQTTFQDAMRAFPDLKIAYGRAVPSPMEWQQSIHDANMTTILLQSTATKILGYADIGIYQLLLPMRSSSEANAFHRSQLQHLIDYEQSNDGELLQTLAAYFDCNGNLARTAELIHVHRNTLLYRLSRISQICHVDLDDADTRLSLWVALRLHRLFFS